MKKARRIFALMLTLVMLLSTAAPSVYAEDASEPAAQTQTVESPKPESKPESKPEPKTETKTESQPAPASETKPETKTESQPAPASEPKSETKTESQSAPASETKTETKTESQSAPASETKTESKSETKTENTDAPKSDAPETSAPATDAPKTEAPKTEAPNTEAPKTDAPTTAAPETSAPVTDAPTTAAPETSAPVTEAPSADPTAAPETSAPATEAPVTEAPSADPTDAPATDAPATEVPSKPEATEEIFDDIFDIEEGLDQEEIEEMEAVLDQPKMVMMAAAPRASVQNFKVTSYEDLVYNGQNQAIFGITYSYTGTVTSKVNLKYTDANGLFTNGAIDFATTIYRKDAGDYEITVTLYDENNDEIESKTGYASIAQATGYSIAVNPETVELEYKEDGYSALTDFVDKIVLTNGEKSFDLKVETDFIWEINKDGEIKDFVSEAGVEYAIKITPIPTSNTLKNFAGITADEITVATVKMAEPVLEDAILKLEISEDKIEYSPDGVVPETITVSLVDAAGETIAADLTGKYTVEVAVKEDTAGVASVSGGEAYGVGVYTVTATLNDDFKVEGYSITNSSASDDFTVIPKAVTLEIEKAESSPVYDGEPIEPSEFVTSVKLDGEATENYSLELEAIDSNASVNGDGAALTAGSYTIKASYTDDNPNYTVKDGSVEVSVAKADRTLEVVLADKMPSYTGSGIENSAFIKSVTLDGELITNYSTSIAAVEESNASVVNEKAVTAGEYTLTVSVSETANYNEAKTTVSVSVAKADITFEPVWCNDEHSLVYNETAYEPNDFITGVKADDVDLTFNEDYTLSFDGNEAEDVGTYSIILAPTDAYLKNHIVNSVKLDVSVTRKTVAVEVEPQSQTYTGAAIAGNEFVKSVTIAEGGLADTELEYGTDYTVTDPADFHVGKYEITINPVLNEVNLKNYTFEPVTTTAEIMPATATITVKANEAVVYDKDTSYIPEKCVTVVIEGLKNDEDKALVALNDGYTLEVEKNKTIKDADTYTITAVPTKALKANYTVKDASADFIINPNTDTSLMSVETQSVKYSPVDYDPYDFITKVTVDGIELVNADGEDKQYTAEFAKKPAQAADDYQITVTVTEAGYTVLNNNYSGMSKTVDNITVVQKEATVEIVLNEVGKNAITYAEANEYAPEDLVEKVLLKAEGYSDIELAKDAYSLSFVDGSDKIKNVGKYTIKAVVIDETHLNNYDIAEVDGVHDDADVEIVKQKATIADVSMKEIIYDKNSSYAANQFLADVIYLVPDKDGAKALTEGTDYTIAFAADEADLNGGAAKNAADYSIVVTFMANSDLLKNYDVTDGNDTIADMDITGKIQPRPAELVLTTKNRVYDGAGHPVTEFIEKVEIFDIDNNINEPLETLNYSDTAESDYSAAFAAVETDLTDEAAQNVAVYSVTVELINEAHLNNYALTKDYYTEDAEIEKLVVTVSINSDLEKYYGTADSTAKVNLEDENAVDLATNFSVTNEVNGMDVETIKAELIEDGLVIEREKGENVRDANYKMTFKQGVKHPNYDVTGEDTEATFTIKRLPVTVTVSANIEKFYGVADPTEEIAKNYTVEKDIEEDLEDWVNIDEELAAKVIRDRLDDNFVTTIEKDEVVGTYGFAFTDDTAIADENGEVVELGKNYKVTFKNDKTFTIKRLPVTVEITSDLEKYYGTADETAVDSEGNDPEKNAEHFSIVSKNGIELDPNLLDDEKIKAELIDDGLEIEREKGENVRDANYKMTFKQGVKHPNYDVTGEDTEAVFTIKRLPVTVTVTDDIAKAYGDADPDISENYSVEKDIDEDLEDGIDIKTELAGKIVRETAETANASKNEGVGDYYFAFTDDKKIVEPGNLTADFGDNYTVTLSNEDGYKFTINPWLSKTFTIEALTNKSTSIVYKLDGELVAPVKVQLVAEMGEAADDCEIDDIPEAEGITTSGSYSFVDGIATYTEENQSWDAGLPVDAVVKLTATALTKEGEDTDIIVEGPEGGKLVVSSGSVKDDITIILEAKGGSGTVYEVGNGKVMHQTGNVSVKHDSPFTEGVWLKLGADETETFVLINEDASFDISMDKKLEGGSTVIAKNDSFTSEGQLTQLSAKLAREDDEQTGLFGFDTGAVKGNAISFENRGLELRFTLPENGSNISVSIGGETFTYNGEAEGGSEKTIEMKHWIDGADLYKSGTPIKLVYTDRAGNQGEVTGSISKSAAPTSATIYIDPVPQYDNTLGKIAGMKVRIYGKGIAHETLIVTVGSRSYTVNVGGSGGWDGGKTKNWYITVNLGEIDFPIDVDTVITVRYEDLIGGEDSTSLRYNDWCLPVLITSPVADGSRFLVGFAEPGTKIEVELNGRILTNAVENTQFDENALRDSMYFFVNLGTQLKEGDTITVRYTDLFENTSEYTFTVESFTDAASRSVMAEAMGASIVGRRSTGNNKWVSEHYFALPVDVEELKALYEDGDNTTNPEIEVPIITYGGYAIGTMNVLYDEGKLYLDYEIDEEICNYSGDYQLHVYNSRPDVNDIYNDLSSGESRKITDAIDTADMGDTIWIYAGFQVSDLGNVINTPRQYFMQLGDNGVNSSITTAEQMNLYNRFNR